MRRSSKNRRGGRITGRENTNHEMEMVKEQSERLDIQS